VKLELGYENLAYRAESAPSWVGSGASEGLREWRRHGFLLGYHIGPHLPLSTCAYSPKKFSIYQQCHRTNLAAFFDVGVIMNVGWLDLRNISEEQSRNEIDLDVQIVGGLQFHVGKHYGVGMFLGALFTDVAQVRKLSRVATYGYDWSIRFIFGAELSFGGDTRLWRKERY
jgi:hypothetical protein